MRAILEFEDALARPEPASAAGSPAVERLRLCARLLALAADEADALSQGAGARRRELAAQRAAMMQELFPRIERSEEEGQEELEEPAPGATQVALLVVDALEALELRQEEERQLQDHWSALDGDALRALQVGGRITAPRAGRYEPGTPLDPRLDVRF